MNHSVSPNQARVCLDLCTLATDSAGELNVLRHDSNTLRVDGAQVCVFEEANEVGLGCFLKRQDSSTLKSKVGLEILGNFTYETLEWSLSDQ
jgi:hypothetical protein